MRYLIALLLQLFGTVALADPPQQLAHLADPGTVVADPFFTEYVWGVQRLPMDGGRIYGWRVNDRLTFGRLQGESDEFGFSIQLNPRERFEMTTDGFRWRKAIGGGH